MTLGSPPPAGEPDPVPGRVDDEPAAAEPVAAEGAEAEPPGRSLGSVAMRGLVTSALGQVLRAVIQFGSLAILARLLTPGDYGLLAMVLVLVGIGEILRDFGLSSASIQAPTLSTAQRDGLFWVNTALGAALAALLLAGAPLVAAFYGEPALTDVTRLLSLTLLLNGAAAQFRASLSRAMRFGVIVANDLTSQVAGVAVAIALAVAGAGVWCLVAQQVTVAAVHLACSAARAGWLPGLPRRGADLRPLLSFGGHLAGSQLIGYAANNVDNLIIGARMGRASLGLYSRAFQLLMQTYNMARDPLSRVAIPLFSRIQEDQERFDQLVVRTQLMLGYLLAGALALAAGLSDPIVALLLGDQWSAASPIFAALAASAVFMTLAFVGYFVYVSRGLTDQLLKYTLFEASVKVGCVLAGASQGVLGVAIGYACAPLLTWPISLAWLSTCTPVPVRDLNVGAGRILVICLMVAGVGRGVVVVGGGWPAVAQLVAGALGALAVVALAALLVPRVRRDIADIRATLSLIRE